VSSPAPKIRCALKNLNPLIADEDNVEPIKASPRSAHCDLNRSCPVLRLMFYSSITSTLVDFGGRWTVDGQRCAQQRSAKSGFIMPPAEGGNASCLCDCFATRTLFLVLLN